MNKKEEINIETMMYSILKKYGLYNKREDYIDICYIGYAKALKKYDSSRSKVTTYVYKCIENELFQYLRKESAGKRKHETESSLDYLINENKNMTLQDIIPNDVDIEQDEIDKETKIELNEALKKLTARERYIIENLFGIGCDEKTQEEIAKHLGISQTQISRLKDKIFKKMRGELE